MKEKWYSYAGGILGWIIVVGTMLGVVFGWW